MAIEVDAVELNIESKSAAAANGIDRLTAALQKMRAATRTDSLKKLGDDLARFESAIKGINSGNMSTWAQTLDTIRSRSDEVGGAIERLSARLKELEPVMGTEKGAAAFEQTAQAMIAYENELDELIAKDILLSTATLTSAIKEGVVNLQAYSSAIGNADSAMASGVAAEYANTLQYVKNSVGAAAGPILQVLLPAIQTLAGWFVQATNAINMFFSALQGKSTYTRAVLGGVTAGADSAAASLGGAASSAKELENTLLGFDELNVLNGPSGSSGGGGGGGGSSVDTSAAQMFEEAGIELPERLLSGIEKLRKAVEGLVNSPGFQKFLAFLGKVVETAIVDAINAIGDALSFVASVFDGDWIGALQSLTDIFVDLSQLAGHPIGSLIDLITGSENGYYTKTFDITTESAREGIKAFFGGDTEGWKNAYMGFLRDIFELQGKDDLAKLMGTAGYTFDDMFPLIANPGNWFDQNLIEPFRSAWNTNMELASNAWEKVKGVWSGSRTWFYNNVVTPIRQRFSTLGTNIQAAFNTAKQKVQSGWQTVTDWFSKNISGPIEQRFNVTKVSIQTSFDTARQKVNEAWGNISSWFTANVTNPVTNAANGVKTGISKAFSDAWTGVKNVWMTVSVWFDNNIIQPIKTAFNTVKTTITNTFNGLWNGLKNGLASAINGVLSAFESLLNMIIRGVNQKIQSINLFLYTANKTLGTSIGLIKTISGVNLGRVAFAQGGFPTTGQLFIANEAGPELVGSMGGRTAVANNDQIVAGIESGVYNAMVSALSGQSGGGAQNVTVNVDGRELFRIVVNQNNNVVRQTGKTPLLV